MDMYASKVAALLATKQKLGLISLTHLKHKLSYTQQPVSSSWERGN